MILVEPLFDITSVEVVGEYRLRLRFEDGTIGDVDFTTREWGNVRAAGTVQRRTALDGLGPAAD